MLIEKNPADGRDSLLKNEYGEILTLNQTPNCTKAADSRRNFPLAVYPYRYMQSRSRRGN
jgi:hypothetical protein